MPSVKEKGMDEVPAEPWSEATQGLCPICLQEVPARLNQIEEQVWITQQCPRHGEHRALIASDAAEYLRLRQYVPDRAGAGCCCEPGSACGPAAGPPTCVLLLEITQACNLRCPTCYADAQGHDFMSVDEAKGRLDRFFKTQSRLDVLMLSGGEPTIHPRFEEILQLALNYPIGRVLINTNGLRIAQSAALVQILTKHRERTEIYLSLSSFQAKGHLHFYGGDLRAVKQAALDKAGEAGLFVNLVVTVETGINDSEIGELYRFALSQPCVAGVVFQPVMENGRSQHTYHASTRMTLTGVLGALEQQTKGELCSTDFVGLPCSHPDCCALTYGFLNHDRTSMTPLPRHLEVSRYLELFSDRISFAGLTASALRRVWSDLTHLRAKQTLQDLALLFSQAGLREALPLITQPVKFGRRVFRVVVKPFMDAPTYDQCRIDQCCTKILTEKGTAISFCEFNVFHRGQKLPQRGIPLTMTSEASANH